MPQLHVAKNGQPLCTVGSDDVWMFSASMHTDIWSKEPCELTVTGGGKRTAEGTSDFLIWEMSHELREGDRIAFTFAEGSASSPKGQLFNDEPNPDGSKPEFFDPLAETEILKLENRPIANPRCGWRFCFAEEPVRVVAVDSKRQNISLHLLWNEMRPESMRVNLSKASLREIVARSGGEELFLQYAGVGAHVEVSVGI
ncbi:MAG: hypothetical protein F9K36_05935 [Burkholderiaceae bacterium]|nr:MAG: hypothetical protein F9K36_05935 [Burkholderiaceae bacterium]